MVSSLAVGLGSGSCGKKSGIKSGYHGTCEDDSRALQTALNGGSSGSSSGGPIVEI